MHDRRRSPSRALLHRLAGAGVALALLTALAPDVERGAADEHALDVEAVAAYAAPTERDLVHRGVDWLPTALDGIVAAQAADKPIVLWLYFGGPLGDC